MIKGATRTAMTRIQQRRTQRRSRCYSTTLDDFLDGGDVDRMLEELDQQLSKTTTTTTTTTAKTSTTFDNRSTNGNNKKDDNGDQQANNSGWIQLSDLDIEIDEKSSKQQSSTSPVHEYKNVFSSDRSSSLYIKRDDLLRLPNSNISGNKGRKMWLLNFVDATKFPKCIVSYGGPQSNSMVALAAIVNSKNRELVSLLQEQDGEQQSQSEQPIQFVYYTKKLPRFLKNQPSGNLFRALALGIQIIELSHQEYSQMFESHFDDYGQPPISLLPPPLQGRSSSKCLWVPQGGAFQSAQIGVNHLAVEIFDYWKQYGNGRPLTVCVPGGTCTTAVLLHHGIKKCYYNLINNKQEQRR